MKGLRFWSQTYLGKLLSVKWGRDTCLGELPWDSWKNLPLPFLRWFKTIGIKTLSSLAFGVSWCPAYRWTSFRAPWVSLTFNSLPVIPESQLCPGRPFCLPHPEPLKLQRGSAQQTLTTAFTSLSVPTTCPSRSKYGCTTTTWAQRSRSRGIWGCACATSWGRISCSPWPCSVGDRWPHPPLHPGSLLALCGSWSWQWALSPSKQATRAA